MKRFALMLLLSFLAMQTTAWSQTPTATTSRGYYETGSWSQVDTYANDYFLFEYDNDYDSDGSVPLTANQVTASSSASANAATSLLSGGGDAIHSGGLNAANQPITKYSSGSLISGIVTADAASNTVLNMFYGTTHMGFYAAHTAQISPTNLSTSATADIEVAWACTKWTTGNIYDSYDFLPDTGWTAFLDSVSVDIDVYWSSGYSYVQFDDTSMYYVPHTDPLAGSVNGHIEGTVDHGDSILIFGGGYDHIGVNSSVSSGGGLHTFSANISHDVEAAVTTPPDGGTATDRSYGGS